MALLRPILRKALTHLRQPAIVDDLGSYSYAKLLGGALFVARTIERTTDAPHVGIMLPTGGGFPIALLGCWLAGRVPVPINYLLSRDDLQHVLKDAQVDTLLTASKLLEHIRTNTADDAIPPHLKLVKLEEQSFKGLPPLRWPRDPDDDELAVLLYTSGTSGKPKGVELTHGNLEANARASIQHAGLDERCVFLGVLPQFHTFGLTVLTLIPLLLGARVVYTARFIPRRIVQLMKEHRPNVFVAVPSMYHALLSVKAATAEDFSSLTFAIAGGEKLPAALDEQYRARFGVQLYEGYGLTETSPVSNWSTPQQHKPGSVGTTIPGVQNIILDEHNQPLPPDHEGEITITGPGVMRAYHGLPELTNQAITPLQLPHQSQPTRLFRTGDIGKLDADGFLYITGRKKEMLIISGENVFPREIEEVLDKHPAVTASAVVGQPDTARGEVPIAFVELDPEQADTFDPSEARNFCRQDLAPFKVPREIRVMDSLPRNPTGKILRRELTAQLSPSTD